MVIRVCWDFQFSGNTKVQRVIFYPKEKKKKKTKITMVFIK